MKRFYSLAILSVLLFPATSFSQQVKPENEPDSLQEKTIVVDPYFSERPLSSIGSFATIVADRNTFHTYAGTNVLNNLRGNVPSLSISPSPTAVSHVGIRTDQAMMVIDGVPFGNEIYSYYNLNSFDFESVTVLSNMNATAIYGGLGSNGGIFLRSKTGEGYSKPSFDFNSYNTLNLKEENAGFYLPGDNRWNFSNSFAYKQDFGAVDTRVSYNFTTHPYFDRDFEGKDRSNSLKINTGLALAKFSARLVGDLKVHNWTNVGNVPGYNPDQRPLFHGDQNFLQGNLFLQYEFAEWLKLTSQHVFSSTKFRSVNDYSSFDAARDLNQNNNLHNMILSMNKALGRVSVTAFAGLQLEKFKYERRRSASGSFTENTFDIDQRALLGGVGMDYKNILYLDFRIRSEKSPIAIDYDESFASTALSGSFFFSRLFMKDETAFLGKIRLSYGLNDGDSRMRFPTPFDFPSSATPLTTRNSLEAGGDFAFLNNRLNFSISAYKVVDEDAWIWASAPFPGGGLENIGELHMKGVEIILGATPIKTSKASLNSKLIFYRNRTEIVSDLNGGETNGSISSTIPDWQGSLLNRVSYARFFLNVLLDVSKGGEVILRDQMNYPTSTIDASYAKFRSIDLGYRFSGRAFRSIDVSLSGRNLIQFNDKDEDIERFAFYPSSYLRSVSLSIGISI